MEEEGYGGKGVWGGLEARVEEEGYGGKGVVVVDKRPGLE